MFVVLGFTVGIRTSLQLHPFDMFQVLFIRYREPVLDFIMMMPSYQMLAFDHAYISQWYSKGSGESAHICTHAQARENLCNSPSQNMDADEHSNINQFKPSVFFCGTYANSGYPD